MPTIICSKLFILRSRIHLSFDDITLTTFSFTVCSLYGLGWMKLPLTYLQRKELSGDTCGNSDHHMSIILTVFTVHGKRCFNQSILQGQPDTMSFWRGTVKWGIANYMFSRKFNTISAFMCVTPQLKLQNHRFKTVFVLEPQKKNSYRAKLWTERLGKICCGSVKPGLTVHAP